MDEKLVEIENNLKLQNEAYQKADSILQQYETKLKHIDSLITPIYASSVNKQIYARNVALLQQTMEKLMVTKSQIQVFISKSQLNVMDNDSWKQLLIDRSYIQEHHPGILNEQFQKIDHQLLSLQNAIIQQFNPKMKLLLSTHCSKLLMYSSCCQLNQTLPAVFNSIISKSYTEELKYFASDFVDRLVLTFASPPVFVTILQNIILKLQNCFYNNYAVFQFQENVLVDCKVHALSLQSQYQVVNFCYYNLCQVFQINFQGSTIKDDYYELFMKGKVDLLNLIKQQVLSVDYTKEKTHKMRRKRFTEVLNNKPLLASIKTTVQKNSIYIIDSHPLVNIFLSFIDDAMQLSSDIQQIMKSLFKSIEIDILAIKDQQKLNVLSLFKQNFIQVILLPTFDYVLQLFLEHAYVAKKNKQFSFCCLDLYQSFIVLYFRLQAIFTDTLELNDSQQHIESLNQLPFQNMPVLKNPFWTLSGHFNHLFQLTNQYLLKISKIIVSKIDYLLFPQQLKIFDEPIVHPQASLILNQLQQLIKYLNIISFVQSEKQTSLQQESDDEQVEDNFILKKILINNSYTSNAFAQPGNFILNSYPQSSDKKFQLIEYRIYYLICYFWYVQPEMKNKFQDTLQKLNTFGYVLEFVQSNLNPLNLFISDAFKTFVWQQVKSALTFYHSSIWQRLGNTMKPLSLCNILLHVYEKWIAQRLYGATQQDYQTILTQTQLYKELDQNVQLQLLKDDGGFNENSDESAIEGLDADQVTESGFSMQTTRDPFGNVLLAGANKAKSKRVKTCIETCANQFHALSKDILAAHRSVSFVNKKLVGLMRNIADVAALQRLEMFQNACFMTPVGKRYYKDVFPQDADSFITEVNLMFDLM